MSTRRTSIELVPASHPGPVAAVTVLFALFAALQGLVADTAARVARARKGKPHASGFLLGVGAHLVHTLPDLFDAAATGLRGQPHHLGQPWIPPVPVGVR